MKKFRLKGYKNYNYIFFSDDHHNRPHGHNSNHCECHNNTTTTILNDLDSETEFLTRHPETNQNLSKCTNNSKNMKCSESNKMLAEHVDSHIMEEYNMPKPEINNKV